MPITTPLDDIPHHVISEGDRGEGDNQEDEHQDDEHQEDEQELSDRIGAEATHAAFIVANQHSTDTNIVNAIALLLGTQREWNGGDCLEDIANLIGLVRQHPGDQDPAGYVARFLTEHPSN